MPEKNYTVRMDEEAHKLAKHAAVEAGKPFYIWGGNMLEEIVRKLSPKPEKKGKR